MIVREDKSWLHLVLMMRKGSIISAIWLRCALVIVFAVFVTVMYETYRIERLAFSTAPMSIMGLALSIFLGFRNNAAYDRFWEGRKLWGRFINTTRSLTRRLLTFTEKTEHGAPSEWQRKQVYRIMGYMHVMRHHLRNDADWSDIEPFFTESELVQLKKESNPPSAVLAWLGRAIRDRYDDKSISAYHQVSLEELLEELMNIQGGCERIKSTPIPLSHTALTHRLVTVYLWSLPFALIASLDYAMPVTVALLAYAFFGLDALGEELEDPFGKDCNDLPLTYISSMIEKNLKERLGEQDLNELPKPNRNGVLL